MTAQGDKADGLVTGLQVLAVYVSELERARSFYEGLLGFKETGSMPPGVALSSGGVMLYLEPGRSPRTDDPGAACGIAPAVVYDGAVTPRQDVEDARKQIKNWMSNGS